MSRRTRRSPDVDRYLAELKPPQRAVACALRRLLLGAGLEEKLMHGVPWFRGQQWVAAIVAHSDHTNVEFYRGSSLRDPHGLLEGTGKNMRHVKLSEVPDVKAARLAALLRDAIDLDAR